MSEESKTCDTVTTMREILGTESGDSWIKFMDFTYENLSDVLKRGKPKKETIAGSLIGKAGFLSWSAMVEAPVNNGGLGWNIAAWDGWKRAYSLVIKHPYLRELGLTASAINTIGRENKDAFPQSRTEYEAIQKARIGINEEKRNNKIKALQDQLVIAKTATDAANSAKAIAESKLADIDTKTRTTQALLNDANKTIGRLTAELKATQKEIENLNITLEKTRSARDKYKISAETTSKQLKAHKNMSFWQKLGWAFKND